jgi:hypothetical protein
MHDHFNFIQYSRHCTKRYLKSSSLKTVHNISLNALYCCLNWLPAFIWNRKRNKRSLTKTLTKILNKVVLRTPLCGVPASVTNSLEWVIDWLSEWVSYENLCTFGSVYIIRFENRIPIFQLGKIIKWAVKPMNQLALMLTFC